MIDREQIIAAEYSLPRQNISNALALWQEGATIPFIARYRKEKTGSLDEIQLRNIFERYTYLTELEQRKQTILEAIASQDKLTESLQNQIVNCLNKTELEDIYLPYKPKRRTKATIAREKGLEPLAQLIQSWNQPKTSSQINLTQAATQYLDETKGVTTTEEALTGASDILAEKVAEKSQIRADLRDYLLKAGVFVSQIKHEHPEGSTKYEMYRNYQASVSKILPHNILALYRGEAEGILNLDLAFEEAEVLSYLESQEISHKIPEIRDFYRKMLKDAFNRLIKPALIREVRADRKHYADLESIKTFEANLRNLLLAPPAGMKPTMAIDPGFRTGCKVAILDETGQFLEYQAIFPHSGSEKRQQAAKIVTSLINKYQIELIALGNGTASRETDRFISEILQDVTPKPIKVIVNESGASIYSASEVAREEFPHLDVTVRGAISIGRRLQDPLAELVKIDPKSIGVGQYQHDVEQKLLQTKLAETVESCVNYVGVDLNTASKELLVFVSGITPTIANNIINYRNQKGKFKNRQQLLKVPKLGAKTFEQAAGFLRIRNGDNPLDNTAVHPESYSLVQDLVNAIANAPAKLPANEESKPLPLPLTEIAQAGSRLKNLDLKQFVSDTVGLPTLEDVVQELQKPGRDPREQFQYANFSEAITEISHLKEGTILEGIVTNVVNFGAFVDLGVHQDGLVHISELADRFVCDPQEIVKVGQVVRVKVLEVNEKLRRIALSLKAVTKLD